VECGKNPGSFRMERDALDSVAFRLELEREVEMRLRARLQSILGCEEWRRTRYLCKHLHGWQVRVEGGGRKELQSDDGREMHLYT